MARTRIGWETGSAGVSRTPANIRLGSKTFDATSLELRDASGEATALRPQTAQVLSILLNKRGKLVSKSEIMDAVWKDTVVTDDSLVQCISEIRKALGPEESGLLKTVARKGYTIEGSPPDQRRLLTRPVFVVPAALAMAVVALSAAGYSGFVRWPGGLRGGGEQMAPVQNGQSLAILPFLNLSGNEDQAYFSDGITDDLITDLSKVSGLMVIARATTFTYRGEIPATANVAKELGVKYILQGSVQREGERLRINAQLSDGDTGANIWAERYEGNLGDVFSLQDRVIRSIVASLKIRLTPAEARRIGKAPTRKPEAYDIYLRGIRAQSFFSRESNLNAQALFQRAIAIDPKFAAAYANLAQAYSLAIENNWSDKPADMKARALAAARDAIRLDPELPYAYWSLGRILTRPYAFDAGHAEQAFRTAVELNPNFADGYIFLALTSIFTGHVEDSLAPIEKAMRLNPDYPFWYLQTLGMAQYFLGNYQASATMYERAIERNPAVPWLYPLLIACYGKLGMVDEADWMAMELEALGQEATIRAIVDNSLLQDPDYEADFVDGLRKAGLRES